MFFKRKEWHASPWWEQVQTLQRKQTRRFADWLNHKVAAVPVKRMRLYIVMALIGGAVLNGARAVHTIRQHRLGPISPFKLLNLQSWKILKDNKVK